MTLARPIKLCLVLIVATAAGLFAIAEAQDTNEQEERSSFIQWVEGIISTPDRQIRLGNISGALSSNVSFSQITVADRDGVWLRIEDVRLVWSRRALLLGRLDITELEAAQIIVERNPHPPEDEIPEEAQLSIPELPVAMEIGRLAVPRVAFGEGVFGLASEISVEGRLRLAGGDLDTALDIQRLDGPGGSLALAANFDGSAEMVDLDLRLSEPEDGVMANLLNLQGRPALDFTIVGSGPLQDFAADIQLLADGNELLAGRSAIARVGDGFRFVADVDGRLGELAPPDYADLFGEASTLAIDATRSDDGAISVARADVRSGVMSLTASAEIAEDGFPQTVSLEAQLGAESEEFVSLPFAGGMSVRSAEIAAHLGAEDAWTARFDMRDLITGQVSAEAATVTAEGVARNRHDPQAREVTFDLSGTASGLTSPDPALAEAMGERIELAANGEWTYGDPVEIEIARFALAHAEATFAGRIVDERVEGEFRLSSDDLSPFARISGLDLQGSAELRASGEAATAGDSFDIVLAGIADDLATGIEAVDGLFAGRTTLSGGISRDDEAVRFDELTLDQPQARARIDGTFGRETVAIDIEGDLPDISVMTDRAGGAARLEGTIAGPAERPTIDVNLTGESLVLTGRPFTDARARFTGTALDGDVDGELVVSGTLDGVPIDARTLIEVRDGYNTLRDIAFSAGDTTASGDLTLRPDGLAEGTLSLDSPDLSVIAPLLLAELRGAVSADMSLSADDDGQAGRLVARARGIRYEAMRLDSADIDATGENLLSQPIIAGTLEAAGIVAGPIEINRLSANAERVGDRTEFSATADLPDGTLEATGRLVPDNGGLEIEFDTFELREASLGVRLVRPVAIALHDGTVTIPDAELAVGGGRVVVAGQAGEQLDLRAEIASLDLAVANTFAPDLGLGGTVSGTLTATGPSDAPHGGFSLQGSGLTAAVLREAGVGALSFQARGDMADGRVALDASASGGGIQLVARGTVPLDGPGLDVAVQGSVPLSLTDMILAERGAALAGTLHLDARVTGSIATPQFAGTVSADGATFADIDTGLQLTGITLRARLTADSVVIDTLTASATGGTLSATGSVGIDPAAGFPADIVVTMSQFRYNDGHLVSAVLSGQIGIAGPLAQDAVIRGQIDIERAEITVPESLPAGATMLDVVHRAPPPPVLETLRRARLDQPRQRPQQAAADGGIRLDLTINAPARLFVRGRGIDAEFGGSVTLTGPVTNIQPIGSFEMRRGHLSILGQRITFSTGTITLVGDLDPMLYFVATTSTRDITVQAIVSGRASDPDVVLSSTPELPQDEVLAQFLFGRSLSDLSPFQLAQLATAAAALVGGSEGTDLLGRLRGATGLDELDVVSGDDGGVAVQAGRYISDNIYLGVRAGEGGDTRASINLDITDEITARGEVGVHGRSRLGIFFEREY